MPEMVMARTHHASSGEPSQRMLRVAKLIRHAMSELLSRGEIVDPVLESDAPVALIVAALVMATADDNDEPVIRGSLGGEWKGERNYQRAHGLRAVQRTRQTASSRYRRIAAA